MHIHTCTQNLRGHTGPGGTCPCTGDGHTCRLGHNSLICQADSPSWSPSSPPRSRAALSAGGPLPAPCVDTCDIHHQRLWSPTSSTDLYVTLTPWQHRFNQMVTFRHLRTFRHRTLVESFGQGSRVVDDRLMGGGPPNAFLPTLQRQCSLGVPMSLLAPFRF